jgi:transmembrane sensor
MEDRNRHIGIELLTRSLAGETSPQEDKELSAWLSVSEANRKEYDELRKTWDLLGTTNPDQAIDVDAEWNNLQAKLRNAGPGKKDSVVLLTFVRIAAVIILVFGISILGIRNFSNKSVKTDIAETEQVILPDGSRVTLNAGSKLGYPKKFGKENRLVALQGEAYFEVERDPSKPFLIEIGDARIKVLGTSFNVRAYKSSEKIEITVTEGKVSLYNRKLEQNKVIATAGEKAEYHRYGKQVTKDQNTNRNYIAWKTRQLIFEDDSLAEVTKAISEVYHQRIQLGDPELNSCRLTTRFEDKDLDGVLKILESTFDLTIKEEKDIIYLRGTGCE